MGNRNTLLQNRKNWLCQFPNDADRMPLRQKSNEIHTVKPTHRFQNTTRRLPKFPRTHRGDILPFVVVAKKHCEQILATMRALLYGHSIKYQ